MSRLEEVSVGIAAHSLSKENSKCTGSRRVPDTGESSIFENLSASWGGGPLEESRHQETGYASGGSVSPPTSVNGAGTGGRKAPGADTPQTVGDLHSSSLPEAILLPDKGDHCSQLCWQSEDVRKY